MSYIDRAYLSIDGVEFECDSINVDLASNIEPRKTMNRENRAKGVTGGIPDFELSAECPMTDDDPVDFVAMIKNRTSFEATIEYEGGNVETYFPCYMKTAKKGSSQGESVNWSLEFLALDMV